MATILVTGDDFTAVDRVRGVVESLGHSLLHSVTTENIVEDILLNEVPLVIVAQNSRPLSEWEVCAELRGDPTLPGDLDVLLLHFGDIDRRRLADSDFDGELEPNFPADVMREVIVRHLGVRAAPELGDPLANSGYDLSEPKPKTPSRAGSSSRGAKGASRRAR